jgi:hypothetical protein
MNVLIVMSCLHKVPDKTVPTGQDSEQLYFPELESKINIKPAQHLAQTLAEVH